MSVLEMEINDNLYLRGEKISEKITVIHLSNGKQIRVEQDVTYNGSIWPWKVDDQYFGKEEYARRYLSTLIWEKMTGNRLIFHAKMKVPDICGVDGAACRCPGKCNLALCSNCPIAEAFFAERDNVRLVYVV